MDYTEYDEIVQGMPQAVWEAFDAAHDERFRADFEFDSRVFLARWLGRVE